MLVFGRETTAINFFNATFWIHFTMLRFPYVYTSPKRIQADGKPVLSLVDGYSESLCASNRFVSFFSSGKTPKVIVKVVIGAELALLEHFMISKSVFDTNGRLVKYFSYFSSRCKFTLKLLRLCLPTETEGASAF